MNIYAINLADSKPYVLLDAPVSDNSVYHRSLSGDNYLMLNFTLPERIDLRRGCFVMYHADDLSPLPEVEFRFELMTNVYPEYRAADGGWKYAVKFEMQAAHMKRYNVFYDKQGIDEVTFTNMTNLEAYAELLAQSMNRADVGLTWNGRVDFPDTMSDEDRAIKEQQMRAIAFKGDKVWDAATRIAEEFKCEWWTEQNGTRIDICFGKMERGTELVIREGEIVSTLPARRGDNSTYGTRFYVFGSTRNLDKTYYQYPQPDPEEK